MSWFKRNSHSGDVFPGNSSPRLPVRRADPNACLEVFRNHWQQAWVIMERQSHQHPAMLPTFDEVNIVINHIDQMITLLLGEKSSGTGTGPILEYLLTENVLEKLFTWGIHSGEFVSQLKLEQLKLYEVLLINSQQDLLVHQPVLRPLLNLLTACGECSPLEVEKRLIVLLNQLCVCLKQNITLLSLFFTEGTDNGPSRFLIFSLLIPFVHREGNLGQQARDALLLCMVLSRKNDSVGRYIAEHSDFCPVLATGLSGLYSLLPRKLVTETEEWYRITRDDVNTIPELAAFLNSLEFCNAVIQLAHPLVQEQLLDYVYQGFLLPVLGPALQENSQQEIVTAMMYLELFLQTVTEPTLMRTFLKFILMERHENTSILEVIVNRINMGSQQMCVSALSLIRSFLDLNCEDVMLELVFKYLIPCTHVMVSQRRTMKDIDLYSNTAQRFFSLIPSCCIPDPTDSPLPSRKSTLDETEPPLPGLKLGNFSRLLRSNSRSSISSLDSVRTSFGTRLEHLETSYNEYLAEAHNGILLCAHACRCWSATYDGDNPSPDSVNKLSIFNKEKKKKNCDNSLSSPKKSSSDSSSSVKSVNSKFSPTEVLLPSTLVELKVANLEVVSHGYGVEARSRSNSDLPVTANQVPENQFNDPLQVGVFKKSSSILQAAPVSRNSFHMHHMSSSNAENCAPKSDVAQKRMEQFPSNLLAFDKNSSTYITLQSLTNETISANGHFSNLLGSSYNNTATPPSSPSDGDFGTHNIGPLLSFLLKKLEDMFKNSPSVNMQLTGVIARLAHYPQPLLRSFLLNPNLVFQPSIRSLIQVLGTLKHKLDCLSYTIDDFDELMIRARQCMLMKEEQDVLMTRRPSTGGETKPRSVTLADTTPKDKRRSIKDFFLRRGSLSGERSSGRRRDIKQNILQSIPGNVGYRYINRLTPDSPEDKFESVKRRNVVYCAIVLEEFLKELAAISQEHTVLQMDEGYFEF